MLCDFCREDVAVGHGHFARSETERFICRKCLDKMDRAGIEVICIPRTSLSDIAGQIELRGAQSCNTCPVVLMCTRWNPQGTWDYRKGIKPCAPDNEILDADVRRFSLRRMK